MSVGSSFRLHPNIGRRRHACSCPSCMVTMVNLGLCNPRSATPESHMRACSKFRNGKTLRAWRTKSSCAYTTFNLRQDVELTTTINAHYHVAPKVRSASPRLAGILASQACCPSQRKGQEVQSIVSRVPCCVYEEHH
jgi:hypothetical protein